MKDYKTIRIERIDHVAVVTLCSPPVNTLTFEILDELSEALDETKADEMIWCIVICSSMKVFCAGADVKNLASCDRVGNIKTSERFHAVFRKIENYPHPVICAVNGVAFGGGFELSLACDLRVFGKKAKISLPEASLGLTPGAGATQRLTRLIGPGKTKQLVYTAASFSAEEAYRAGICEYVTGDDATTVAIELAKKICSKAPIAVSLDKKCINYSVNGHSIVDGLEYETYVGSDAFLSEDQKEGTKAFFDKRPPIFKNK